MRLAHSLLHHTDVDLDCGTMSSRYYTDGGEGPRNRNNNISDFSSSKINDQESSGFSRFGL